MVCGLWFVVCDVDTDGFWNFGFWFTMCADQQNQWSFRFREPLLFHSFPIHSVANKANMPSPTSSQNDNIPSADSQCKDDAIRTSLRICCYGSSSKSTQERYLAAAYSLGYELGIRGHCKFKVFDDSFISYLAKYFID